MTRGAAVQLLGRLVDRVVGGMPRQQLGELGEVAVADRDLAGCDAPVVHG